ncbi:cyclin-dependent kinase inhibitor 3 isoform X4 [Mauremys reevesii]|uniref:cyclin-dependent kinase inhibitor 3 isoform X4 n=1 Tax=Mauremys reevesii TaxID=260615 RepID=UPI00193F4118|nr:cyclin-dependent kinase inhibitor 3 isoform X4 [Mauremys reevesii]
MQANEFDSSDEEPIQDDQIPFQISWLALSSVYCSQFLGVCSLPGCRFKDVRRNLQKDIEELKRYGTQDIFVLCTRGELSKYRVPNLLNSYQQHGIIVHHHPIPDGDTPDIANCCTILEELRGCLENNRKTLIHCYGGLGRSCLILSPKPEGCQKLQTPQKGNGAETTISQNAQTALEMLRGQPVKVLN